jgi:hypothetical protein
LIKTSAAINSDKTQSCPIYWIGYVYCSVGRGYTVISI